MDEFAPRPRAEEVLKLRATPLRRAYLRARTNLQSKRRLPLRDRLSAWRHGFTYDTFVLYQLQHNDPRRYLPDFVDINYRLRARYRDAINEKLGFSRLLHDLDARQPRALAFVQRGSLLSVDIPERAPGSAISLRALLEQVPHVVFRPIGGLGGRGLAFVRLEDRVLFRNDVRLSDPDAAAWLSRLDHHMVTAFVPQAPYAAELFATTPNTIRVLTLWDHDRGVPFVAAAAHRIGTVRSAPTDNFHAGYGGLSANLDLESGVLGPGVKLDDAGGLIRNDRHPDTGARIVGVEVPGWAETRAEILRVAAAMPQFAYVGWDLLMSEEGGCFIEGNSPPGTAVWQVHTPLLDDPRARAFFEAHGFIPPRRDYQ